MSARDPWLEGWRSVCGRWGTGLCDAAIQRGPRFVAHAAGDAHQHAGSVVDSFLSSRLLEASKSEMTFTAGLILCGRLFFISSLIQLDMLVPMPTGFGQWNKQKKLPIYVTGASIVLKCSFVFCSWFTRCSITTHTSWFMLLLFPFDILKDQGKVPKTSFCILNSRCTVVLP